MPKINQNLYCNPEVWGGIECTINRVGDRYFDQLQYSGHYKRSRDIEQIASLGIKKIRYPILWEKHQPSNLPIDWTWIDKQLSSFKHHNIDVIAGLVHHGSGPSYTNLLDKNFPFLLADYAKKVATEFPWINVYTPVNEPLTTARFSGLYGVWYPHLKDDRVFISMLLNEVKAVVLAMQEIRKINPEAKLIQTEDLAKTYSTEKLKYQAEFENERRWITFDLLSGRVNKEHPLWVYLKWLNIPEDDLYFFSENVLEPDIQGFNYYTTSERFIDERIHLYPKHTHGGNYHYSYADVEAARVELEEDSGITVLLKEAWDRYNKPIAITEVHLHCHREEQLRWFRYVWNACKKVNKEGVDIQGVTAWAMLGSYGWNKLLTKPKGEYEPGIFDLRASKPRPTALATFIKEISSQQECYHPVSAEKGWWERDNRFIHEPMIEKKPQSIRSKKKDQPVLIIGKNGTLGRAFSIVCNQRFIHHKVLSRQSCDIAELNNIEAAIEFYKPWAIINAAGYVRVDDAENEEGQCFRENTFGAYNLSVACKQHGVKLVTFSTDLVFDGDKPSAYLESDPVNPLNVYGRSKAEAEQLILQNDHSSLIIRTSAFFGPWDQYNFLHWVISTLNEQQEVTVASDVLISPTYVPDLVHATLDLVIDDEKDIWHIANKGAISWAELAQEAAKQFDLNADLINSVPIAGMNLQAQRPKNSVLSSEKGIILPNINNALERYFDEKRQEIYA